MAAPVTGPVDTRGGSVRIRLEPPLEFIRRQFGSFRRELEDLDPLWDRFAVILPGIFSDWFASHGDGAWPALAESTLAEKSKQGYPADPLIRTGALRDTLIDPGSAVERSPVRMAWGTDVAYAVYHQEGTSKMPQRQVIPDPFPAKDRQKLEVAVVEWVNEAAARMAHGVRAA